MVNGKRARVPKAPSAREVHMQGLQEEWEDEDDDSDFQGARATTTAAAALIVKKERVVKKERTGDAENPIIKMEDGTANQVMSFLESSTIDVDAPTQIPGSSIKDLDAPPHTSESILNANTEGMGKIDTTTEDSVHANKPLPKTSLELDKTRLIEQLSQCGNTEELCRVLMNGLEIAEVQPERPQKKIKSEHPVKRKRV